MEFRYWVFVERYPQHMDLSSAIVAEAIVALKSQSPIGEQEQKRIHASLCPLTNASVKFLVCPLSECQRLIDKLKEGPRAANVIVARVMIQTGSCVRLPLAYPLA